MEQFYPSLVPNFTCLVHGIHFSKTFPKVLNYYELDEVTVVNSLKKNYVLGLKGTLLPNLGPKPQAHYFWNTL